MKLVIWTVAAAVFVLAVPLFIFSSNGLALAFDADFYSRGEIEQRVEQVYGLPQSVLAPVNRAIVRYFQGETATLPESLEAEGADAGFFNERELIHMEDVRGLIRLVGLVQRASLLYGIMFLVASVALFGTKAVGRTGTCLIVAGGLTIALVLLAGVLTVSNFGDLFLRFHLLSFSNDFWLLDPRTDRLVQMVPYGFWYNAMLVLVLRSLLSTGAAIGVGVFFVWLGRRLL